MRIHAFFLLLTVLSVWSTSCSTDQQPKDYPKPQAADSDDVFLFESDSEWTTIEHRMFEKTIKAFGMIEAPPESQASVSAQFEGYVRDITIIPGQKVTKGQTLFTLENPAYIQVQSDYLEAKGKSKYLTAEYHRQRTLFEDSIASEKVFLKAESEYQVNQIQVSTLRKKMMLMNINPNTVSSDNLQTVISVKAPISGFITQVNANRGTFLNPDDVAVEMINSDHLHLELKVFEEDYTQINVGQKIVFKTQNGTRDEYFAYVFLASSVVDPETRMATIHAHLEEGSDSKFTLGMYVEAEITVFNDTIHTLPESAVDQKEDDHFIYARQENQNQEITIVPIKVIPGHKQDGWIEILNAQEINSNLKILIQHP